MRSAGGLTVKRLEGTLQRAEERRENLTASDRDPAISFENTGIDYLCLDLPFARAARSTFVRAWHGTVAYTGVRSGRLSGGRSGCRRICGCSASTIRV